MPAKITVLGIGNPIMEDDGIGLELLRQLEKQWMLEPDQVDRRSDEKPFHLPSQAADPTARPEWGVDANDIPPTDAPALDVQFIDGGTCGMELLPIVQDAQYLLLLDAVTGPGAPGSVVVREGDQVPRLLKAKLSPHQVGLLDLLAAARLLHNEPEHVAVVGIVAKSTELNVGLTEAAKASVAEAVQVARELMQTWLQD
ncbi:hydrogenase maturation protease [Corynebacterium sp. H113]|uniref:hydrogenase maturation protease n=1 Tax=Corynebacterium sp. H113 TaxID=3133419 RepID=UPI0030A35165